MRRQTLLSREVQSSINDDGVGKEAGVAVTTGRAHQVELVESDGAIEVVDRVLGTWIARVEPASLDTREARGSLAFGTAVAGAFAQQLPGFRAAARTLADSSGGLRVVFSPDVQKGLLDGSFRLMEGAKVMPVAINGAGKITEIGTVVAPASFGGLGAAGGVGGGTLTAGAVLGAAWPIVLAGAVAAAAAYAEHRWLQERFSELESTVNRIEWRMRDDDFGVLEAATHLVDYLGGSGDAFALPTHHKIQLAVAHQQVESVYLSRRRFVERFKRLIEERQTEHEEKKGERRGWVKGVADQLAPGKGASEELSLFVAAMITRAKTMTASAGVLVGDGEAVMALRAIRDLHESLRRDYYDLYRRLRALARHAPEAPRWRRVVPLFDEDDRAAHALVSRLVAEMERTVGAAVPEMDEPLELPAALPEGLGDPTTLAERATEARSRVRGTE